MSVRDSERALLVVAMTLSLALMLAGFITGFQTNLAAQSELHLGEPTDLGHTWLSALGKILFVNVPALCLVFSGVITGGLTTLIAWPLTAVYIGATMRIGQVQLGVAEVVSSIWIYAPVEFLALLLAAGAGLMPITAAIRSTLVNNEPITPLNQYVQVIPFALKTFGVASILLAVAAVLEATVLAFKGFV
jgi:uncharacterized membrane protein SpoIIM required for sporulation